MFECVRGYEAFRYRIYPTAEQEQRLIAWEHALRFLWNLALEQRKLGLARPLRIYPKAFDQITELTPLRAELPFLEAVPRNVCIARSRASPRAVRSPSKPRSSAWPLPSVSWLEESEDRKTARRQ